MAKEETSAQDLFLPADAHRIVTMETLRYTLDQLKEHIAIELNGRIWAIDARLTAIDRATDKFEENLTRVPTETTKAVGQLQMLMEEKFATVEAHRLDLSELRVQLVEDVERQISDVDKRLTLAVEAERRAKAQIEQIIHEKAERVESDLRHIVETRTELFHSQQQQFSLRDLRQDKLEQANKEALAAALQASKEANSKSEMAQTEAIKQLTQLVQAMSNATDSKIADIKDRLTRIEGQSVGQQGAKQETHQGHAFLVSIIGLGLALLAALASVLSFMRTLPLVK